jgi:uncharacterized protein YndB with AHSA1/START domain
MSGTTYEVKAIGYELEVSIDAPKEVVWKAMTEETNAWWLPDFHMVGAGSTVSLDTRAGGQLVESMPDGGSLLWYTVQMCVEGESLDLVGHLGPDYGGPATTLMRLALEDRDGATVLKVRDALYGHVSDAAVASLSSGWKMLFEDGLKHHVEAR